jgi:hypothetical protein
MLVNLAEQLLGRELQDHAKWNSVLFNLSIIGFIIFSGLLLFIKFKLNTFIIFMRKHFLTADNEVQNNETQTNVQFNKKINVPILEILRNNSWLILSMCVVFIFIFVFYTIVHPIIPYHMDDWIALGGFRSLLPDASEFVSARVFSGVVLPMTGLFAAYIVNPFMNDYLVSISFTTALVSSFFIVVFYLSLYRLIFAHCRDKLISIISGLLVLCLYFAFFKTQGVGSSYMFWAESLGTYFMYTISNLLNGTLVCIFMRYSAQGTYISSETLGRKYFILLVVALYFAIFSVLFAIFILAFYCFFELMLCFLRKETKTKNLYLFVVILIGFAVYMLFEFTSTRANSGMTNIPVFSVDFLESLQDTFKNFYWIYSRINKLVLFITLVTILLALILLLFYLAKDKNNPLVRNSLICILCMVCLFPAYMIVIAKIGSYRSGNIMYMYGIFSYYILLFVFSLIYIISKFRKITLLLPFLLILFFVEATNGSKPYADQWDYVGDYFGHRINTQTKREFNNMWIEQIKLADKNGDESVIIHVPESSYPGNWPTPAGRSVDLSNTLYAHGIISRKIIIILQPDREMTESLPTTLP